MMCYKYVRQLYHDQLFTAHLIIAAVLVVNDFFIIMYFGVEKIAIKAPGGH